jgi:hypothetical protein
MLGVTVKGLVAPGPKVGSAPTAMKGIPFGK